MTNRKNKLKSDFTNLIHGSAENQSSSKDAAKSYLESQGLDTGKLLKGGLQRIRQMQMMANAKRTQQEQAAAEAVKQQAEVWVDQLLGDMNFSLPELIKEEQLSMSFRNVESLSKEDIRNLLIKHYTLKFMNKQNGGNK